MIKHFTQFTCSVENGLLKSCMQKQKVGRSAYFKHLGNVGFEKTIRIPSNFLHKWKELLKVTQFMRGRTKAPKSGLLVPNPESFTTQGVPPLHTLSAKGLIR